MKHIFSRMLPRAAATLGVVVSIATASAGPIKFETIAVQGGVASGTGGDTFSTFGIAKVQAGSVAFEATSWGGGLDFANGVWSDASGSVSLLGLTPSQAHAAKLIGFDGANAAIHRGHEGFIQVNGATGPTTVASLGDAAPGTAGATLQNFYQQGFSDGRTTFIASLTGNGITSANNLALYSHENGALTLLGQKGTSGVLAASTAFPGNVAHDSGAIAFLPDAGTRSSIVSDIGGALATVLAVGDSAPTTAGGTFTSFEGVGIGSDGLTFKATWAGGAASGSGIFSGNPGTTLELIARNGDAAPELAPSHTFATLLRSVPDYDEGRTVFRSYPSSPGIAATVGFGLWSHTAGGGLELVAKEGDTAPGTNGATFNAFDNPMTDGGRMAFLASLNQACCAAKAGLFAEDPLGNLTLVVREGDVLEVASGDPRTVRELIADLSPNPTGFRQDVSAGSNDTYRNNEPQGFDEGQLAFTAIFDDGTSAVILATVGTQELQTLNQGAEVTTGFLAASDLYSGISLNFDEVTVPGNLTVTQTSAVPTELETGSSAFVFDAFAAPVVYDVDFDGTFTGGVDLLLRYNPDELLIPEEELVVYHLTDTGDLVALTTTVFAQDNYVIATTPGFSGFVLGAGSAGGPSVPEPASLLLAGLGCIAAYAGRRRRRGGR